MVNVYARAVTVSLVGNGTQVTKTVNADLQKTDGQSAPGIQVQVTLAFDANQTKWTQAIIDAISQAVSTTIDPDTGNADFSLAFVYLSDPVSLKP